MLGVSTLRSPSSSSNADQHCGGFVGDHHHVVFPTSGGGSDCCDGFSMVDVDDNLLDYIAFSCDVPFFDADGDILPDLEVDPTELLAEFSSTPPPDDLLLATASPAAVHVDDEAANKAPVVPDDDVKQQLAVVTTEVAQEEKRLLEEQTCGDEKHVAASKQTTEEDSCAGAAVSDTKSSAEGHSKRKPAPGKNSHGKRKVDWTPELHRRFVQAVEQLGIDKAVPSRILEIMGMDCLTRHNIASHLQKYRSHRKHLMAREAEAATWAQKRHMYAAAGGVAPRTDAPHGSRPWVVPTIGFPPPAPPPFCRPLHVWGHPPHAAAAEAAAAAAAAVGAPPTPTPMLPVWPRHLAPPRPLPPWAHPHPPAVDPAFWHQQYNAARKWGPQAAAVTQGTPACVPPPAAAMLPRFPVPGMVPHPIYRPAMVPPPPPPPSSKLAELQLELDTHPSKESIDAAIGDVLVKPWLPLPLGLKPPLLDSVMSELHKQGVPSIPPAATTPPDDLISPDGDINHSSTCMYNSNSARTVRMCSIDSC